MKVKQMYRITTIMSNVSGNRHYSFILHYYSSSSVHHCAKCTVTHSTGNCFSLYNSYSIYVHKITEQGTMFVLRVL